MDVIEYRFTEYEVSELRHYRDNQKNANLKIRFIALLMLSEGIRIEAVATVLGKCIKTIVNWFVCYIEKGIESLNFYNYVPKKQFLSEEQVCKLIDWVRNENPSSCREVALKIKADFSVKYTDEGVRKLLKRNGLKFAFPKTVPGGAPSEEEQKKFVEEYNEIKESRDKGTVVLFADGMHLLHQNVPGRCWIDPKNPPVNKTNTGRKRINILGAYNPYTFSLIHLTGEENCNAQRVIEFFEKIRKVYASRDNILIILDNASYFKAAAVRERLEKNPKIRLIFLPPYCPNLNLIERLWRFVREETVINKYHEKYITFRAKVFQVLNSIGDHKEKLKTLMVENFEIIKHA